MTTPMTTPMEPVTVALVHAPFDRDEVTIVAHVGAVELARVIVLPDAVPAGCADQTTDLIAALLRQTLHAADPAP